MSKQILEHKGFQGSVEFSLENNILFGRILHIHDVVSYDADTVSEIYEAFKEAVDDYIETCAELGVEPNKPYSGTFNVRIGRRLHREAAQQATREDKSINDFIKDAIECHLHGRHQQIHHHYPTPAGYEADYFIPENARRVPLRVVQ
ncbi:type II toxin-antitoxin system HicB family antitoxin [Stutzerimonas nitrititolerans]|uniref:type II toxin-antitoxin system HicB family antitoxin n=1 Tax=Stutzerimonas nitrititolerans TaxID=2482751 RepID=UPI0028AF9BB8|nr:type II toxin-antitoxin system HicB family antitoxin [Stutzerimonas nitrititolerans]